MTQIPRKRFALVLHRRLYLKNEYSLVQHTENICIECTLVNEDCIEYDIYTKVICATDAVTEFIYRSKSNIIVSHFHQVLLSQHKEGTI